MKTVFDNRMVAHVWAQQDQAEGRSNNGQLFFDGPTIFSYGRHFPIARFVTTKGGARYVLFTSRGYSITTSKHKSFVRRALSSSDPIYYVRDVTAEPMPQFAKELEDEIAAAVEEKAEGRRNHERRALAHLQNAARVAQRANEFAQFTGDRTRLKAPAVDPATIEKAAKVKAKADKAKAARLAQQQAERLAAFKVAQKLWLNGTGPLPGTFDADGGGAALRIVGDELQTSHGASVPLAHAIRAFRFLKLVRERGRGWAANGHSLRVGHFTGGMIEPDGSFRAGCHYIRWPEIERVARLAGVFDEPANDCALTETEGRAA